MHFHGEQIPQFKMAVIFPTENKLPGRVGKNDTAIGIAHAEYDPAPGKAPLYAIALKKSIARWLKIKPSNT
jgi:hypothetical protein